MIPVPRALLPAIAIVLHMGGASSGAAATADFEFFKTRVQPIFLKQRVNHARCVVCHAERAGNGFSLQPLAPGSSAWTDDQSQRNYAVVSRLVAPGDPTSSPLLMHPLAPEAGGDPFHSGGRQFESQEDPDWQVLAAWVRQMPVIEYSNLKVLKSGPQVVAAMRYFNLSLRGDCLFCHAAGDFASDANPRKLVARQMIQMVQGLNTNLGAGKVSCYTCHRGEQKPKTVPNLKPAA